MLFSILLMIHMCCATVGLLSGSLAMALPKGTSLHRLIGNAFFISMLAMSSSAAYMAAFMKPVMINVIVGLLTCYLVATAWRAGRRRDSATGFLDLVSFLFVLGVGTAGLMFGLIAKNSPDGMKDGMPAEVYFVFGTLALLCAASDFRLLRRGSLVGARRIARHLWRMSLALLIGMLSLYPGQGQLFPDSWRETNLLFVPHVLVAGSMLFWMARVAARRSVRTTEATPTFGRNEPATLTATGRLDAQPEEQHPHRSSTVHATAAQ